MPLINSSSMAPWKQSRRTTNKAAIGMSY
jgi:hypothetical protein